MPRQSYWKTFYDKAFDFDAFGETFQFKLPDGKDEYKSCMGLVLTIFCYSLLVTYSSFKIKKVWNFGDTNVNLSHEDSYFDYKQIWSSEDGLQFAFAITAYDNEQESIEDPHYGELLAAYYSWGMGDDMSVSLEKLPLK